MKNEEFYKRLTFIDMLRSCFALSRYDNISYFGAVIPTKGVKRPGGAYLCDKGRAFRRCAVAKSHQRRRQSPPRAEWERSEAHRPAKTLAVLPFPIQGEAFLSLPNFKYQAKRGSTVRTARSLLLLND